MSKARREKPEWNCGCVRSEKRMFSTTLNGKPFEGLYAPCCDRVYADEDTDITQFTLDELSALAFHVRQARVASVVVGNFEWEDA